MFNKKIIIIILAVVIFFSSAAAVFFLVKRAGNKVAVNNQIKSDITITDELKNYYPELSSAQIKFYTDTATQKTVSACLKRADESACVASVAFIRGNSNLCHSLENKDEKIYIECVNNILKKKAGVEVSQCVPLSGDGYYNCLGAVFAIYSGGEDCVGLPDLGALAACQDFFNYQTVYLSYDRKLCQTIKDEKLNQYCLKNIVEKK